MILLSLMRQTTEIISFLIRAVVHVVDSVSLSLCRPLWRDCSITLH